MNQQLSPQIQAVLKILEQRMGAPPASFNERFDAAIPSFDERFRTFDNEAVGVMPHEVQYGASRGPYEDQMIVDMFRDNPPMLPPSPPQRIPGEPGAVGPGKSLNQQIEGRSINQQIDDASRSPSLSQQIDPDLIDFLSPGF